MNSHRKVSTLLISCLSILKYTVYELLCFSVFPLRTLKILASYDVRVCLPFCVIASLSLLNSPTTTVA